MLLKISVDELFIHHFRNVVYSLWDEAPRPPPGLRVWILLGTYVLQTP